MYTPPTLVISPKIHWNLITVLEDGGPSRPSLAVGRWDNNPVLALRWNGNDENPTGNPQSRGLATWFVIPDGFVEAILSTLSPDKLLLARNFLPAPGSDLHGHTRKTSHAA
jgi:hypothetical protein